MTPKTEATNGAMSRLVATFRHLSLLVALSTGTPRLLKRALNRAAAWNRQTAVAEPIGNFVIAILGHETRGHPLWPKFAYGLPNAARFRTRTRCARRRISWQPGNNLLSRTPEDPFHVLRSNFEQADSPAHQTIHGAQRKKRCRLTWPLRGRWPLMVRPGCAPIDVLGG